MQDAAALDLSIVIPVYNSAQTLHALVGRLLPVLAGLTPRFEVVFIDDGSRDDSWKVLNDLADRHPHCLTIIQLMRNFGQHNAIMCGLRNSRGQVVVTMDDDLQNPPEEIPRLLAALQQNNLDLVYGCYGKKKQSAWRNRGSGLVNAFYRIVFHSTVTITSFRAVRRELLKSIFSYNLNYTFLDGLLAWNTQRIGQVEVAHHPRGAGRSGYSLGKLVSLALNLFTNFSLLPLQFASGCGVIAAGVGFLGAFFFCVQYFLSNIAVPGYASIIVALLILGGLQLLALGIMGEYMGRLHLNVNRKPQYVEREVIGAKSTAAEQDPPYPPPKFARRFDRLPSSGTTSMPASREPVLLVLGVGGNVSQGILKALAVSSLSCRVVGACISPQAMGLYTVGQAYISPRADDPSFLPWLVDVCRKEQVQGVLSGVEPVLQVLAANTARIREKTGATAVVSPPEKLAVCDDKLATACWLRKQGLNYPESCDGADRDGLDRLRRTYGFPLIAKPRRGKGSQGVRLIRSEQELDALAREPDYLAQQYLADAENEFTAATLSDPQGLCRGVIVLRRHVRAGTTAFAEAGEYPEVAEEVRRIAEALQPVGPCNMQLRVHEGKAVCFEINLRFSGTSAIRAHFGFNDAEAAVRQFILAEPPVDLPRITQGKVLRYWNELYLTGQGMERLAREGFLPSASAGVRFVESYGANTNPPSQTWSASKACASW